MEVLVNQIEKRSWIEIDVGQIRRNYLTYKKHLKKDAKIMAIIKADAYGHGDVQIARLLSDIGCDLFAVSNIDEAVGLRESGIKGEILILGYSAVGYAKTLCYYDLIQTVVSEEYADALAATGYRVKCQLAVDTGMNRIGIDADNPSECERIIRKTYEQLNLTGIFTHLCVADSDDTESKEFTLSQINKFKTVAESVLELKLPYVHCCNSAGGLFYLKDNETFKNIGDIVRLGIILYGLKPEPSNELPEGIAPAMTWKSTISMVKSVHAGETIGYGRAYKVEKDSVIATVTTGYADGFSRLLSNKGSVMIHGQKAPVVGRVCMDQILVDVSHIENVKMADVVIIIGKYGELQYNADDMAKELNTIGYEVICNITKRVQRFYINSNSLL